MLKTSVFGLSIAHLIFCGVYISFALLRQEESLKEEAALEKAEEAEQNHASADREGEERRHLAAVAASLYSRMMSGRRCQGKEAEAVETDGITVDAAERTNFSTRRSSSPG